MANNIKGITIEIGGNTGPLDKALKDVNKTSRDLQSELREVNRQLKLDPSNTTLLNQKQKLLAESITNTKSKLETLREAEKQVEQQFRQGKVGEEQYRAIQREVIKTEQELKNLESQALKSQAVLSKDQAVGNLKKIASAAGLAAVAIGAVSVKLGAEFETAMAKVSTIADTTQVPLEELEKSILDLSKSTGISANEIADNVYNAISAGQSTSDAVNFVSNSTKLAKAGFAEAGQSLDVLTTILNAYGMESSEVTKVSDMLVQTQNKGKTTVAELSSVMGKIIPTANATGVSLEQLTAGYAIMTSKGIAAAETTTYMNSMFNELSKTGSKTDVALREISGKGFTELMASGASVSDVLAMLDDSAKQNNLTLNDMFGSAEAGKAALVLLGDGADTFNNSVNDMRNSTGATDEAFGKVTDTVNERFNIAINTAKNYAIELYDSIKPLIIALIDMVTWLMKNEAALTLIGVAIGTVTALVIAFNIQQALLASGMTLWSAIAAGATAITTALGVAFAFLTSPIGLVILAIGAVIAIGVLLYRNWDTVKEKASQLGSFLSSKFSGIKESIMSPVRTAADFIGTQVDKIRSFFSGLKIEMPKIKLPHFSIQGSFSLKPPSVPSLGVDWYDKGGIFSSPQIIGVGEKRPEFVGALDDLRYLIRDELNKNANVNSVQTIVVPVNLEGQQIATVTAPYSDRISGTNVKLMERGLVVNG